MEAPESGPQIKHKHVKENVLKNENQKQLPLLLGRYLSLLLQRRVLFMEGAALHYHRQGGGFRHGVHPHHDR